jgi:hypothetical protein
MRHDRMQRECRYMHIHALCTHSKARTLSHCRSAVDARTVCCEDCRRAGWSISIGGDGGGVEERWI